MFPDVSEPVSPISLKGFAEFGETLEYLPSPRKCVFLTSRSCEAGSDPRGPLLVTWGVYLCAGKPPLADIILSHPPDLT